MKNDCRNLQTRRYMQGLTNLNDYVLDTIGRRIKATGRASAYDQQGIKEFI